MAQMVRRAAQKKMPIFAANNSRRVASEAGFTLVELMVALAIMGLAAAAVVMTLPDGGGALRDEADRLSARIAAVRDLAVVEGRGTAAVVQASGYGFERRQAGEWQPLQDRAFRWREWPAGVSFTMSGEGVQARIQFSRLGTSPTPQSLTLTNGEAQERIHISASGEISRGK